MTTKVEPTVEKWEIDDLRDILESLVLEVGYQVTRDYEEKNGIWEGMSISNVRSIDKAMKKLSHSVQEAKAGLIQEIEGMKFTEDQGIDSEMDSYNGALDEVITLLKGET